MEGRAAEAISSVDANRTCFIAETKGAVGPIGSTLSTARLSSKPPVEQEAGGASRWVHGPIVSGDDALRFIINTHDSWGVVAVGEFPTLAAARAAFTDLCADPWYRADGTVKGVELLQRSPDGNAQRLEWFPFS